MYYFKDKLDTKTGELLMRRLFDNEALIGVVTIGSDGRVHSWIKKFASVNDVLALADAICFFSGANIKRNPAYIYQTEMQ